MRLESAHFRPPEGAKVGTLRGGGRVALVGAGPGDPDLLTLRAEAELQAAATVVTDVAVQALALAFAPQAEVLVVPDRVAAVHVLLAAASETDRSVVRLYAGDPWLHPAHGGELAALREAGIATDSVAGVAVELAVPALAGIAVHVRHLAVVCTLVLGDDVPASADPAHTVVVPCSDGAAAAGWLAAGGWQELPAAVLPCDAGSVGPCLLVVGAVAAAPSYQLTGGGQR